MYRIDSATPRPREKGLKVEVLHPASQLSDGSITHRNSSNEPCSHLKLEQLPTAA